MLPHLVFSIIILLFANIAFADDIPAEVQDVIDSMTKEIRGGKAREGLKIDNPYNNTPNKKIANEEKIKKAKFNLDFKVISCSKDEMPDFLDKKVIKHDACGDLDAKIMFDDTLDIYLTKESKFDNLKPSKIIRTIPEITKEGDNYIIEDKQIINTVNLGVEVFVVPTTIIKRQVQLDLAVRTTELADIDEVYLDSNDRNFVNNEVALKHRFLVASFPVDINQAETLGGNSAILVPMTSDFKSPENYPETARLWLEVNLRLPNI